MACYIPTQLDKEIAGKTLGQYSPYTIATLRGMYDEVHPDVHLDSYSVDEAHTKLFQYRKELVQNSVKQINNAGDNLASHFKTLKNTFTATERFNRINMISTLFSSVVDSVLKSNPQYSRKSFIEGVQNGNGGLIGGQFNILSKVYTILADRAGQCKQKGEDEKAEKLLAVLDNWNALIPFVRMKLRDTEGLKLGNNLEYADETDESNYNDNVLESLFNASESTREGWQEMNDAISSFGTVSKNVRKFLSNIPLIQITDTTLSDGTIQSSATIVKDDLGFPIMLDPVKAHQSLMQLINNATSESDIITKLKNVDEVWLNPIINALQSNNQLRTQFKVDFHKNFQPYSNLIRKIKNGIYEYKTAVLNKERNTLVGNFIARINFGTLLDSNTSVYNVNGDVDYVNLAKLKSKIEEWTYEKTETKGTFLGQETKTIIEHSKYKNASKIQKRKFLVDISNALGIDLDADTADKIIGNKDGLKYLKYLNEFFKFGVSKSISDKDFEKINSGESNFKAKKYETLIKKKTTNNKGESEQVAMEKINKALDIIAKYRDSLKMESKVRYKDSKGNSVTLYSHVNASFLGDRLGQIQDYVDANDKQGLKKYIEDNYLVSSFFKYEGEILNKWLEDLISACDNENVDLKDSFAAKLNYQRFLGTSDNIPFEDFTSKQHAIDMLCEYWADAQQNKPTTALYPIFILGDSGVSKYIRAKRYAHNDLLEGFWKVYIQESRRMNLVKASNKLLQEQGYKEIDHVASTSDSYSFLSFLNEEKWSNKLNADPFNKEHFYKVLEEYMQESVKDFISKLSEFEVLETKKIGGRDVYVHLNQEIKTEEDLETKITDFYWNTKFATIQQLQLMTIDTAFYGGTKDLQKRYKEIHAPGTILSLEAKDFDNNLYSKDGIERVIYFDDISLNAELTDPNFAEVIKKTYSEDSPIYAAYTKLKKGDKEKDSNTVTDGQGYRSLSSYRKVMGMSGQWTQEMETAYKAINSLRASYSRTDSIPNEVLEEIANYGQVFQPIKPYLFTHEKLQINENDCLLIPVQHKYAEAVLIPELLPANSKLRDMAYYMEDNNIDMIGSTKVVKVGAFGSTNIKDVKNSQELAEALSKGKVHQLNYEHYRIQTNVPEHINCSRLFGTQVRKLIMSNVDLNDNHYTSYVGGQKVNLGGKWGEIDLNGRNLISFYNSLIVSNILQDFNRFKDNVINPDKLSKMLIQNVLNNSRESQDNTLAFALEDNDFTLSLFEGGLEHDSAAFLLSTFKKLVNKQTINGGSAVQVSCMGINSYENDGDLHYICNEDNTNILYAEVEVPWDLSYTNERGQVIDLKFSDYCNSDGTLILSEDGKTSKLEKHFPGILDFVAYRIPTEQDYSMINCKIKRFSQKSAGGTIKVPAPGTTTAGFDFDIDKLYFMRKEFNVRTSFMKNIQLSEEDKLRVLENIKETHPECIKSLPPITTESFTQEQLYEIFGQIYEDYPTLKANLKALKDKSNSIKALNSFFEESTVAKYLAEQKGFTEVSDFKNYLVQQAAEELGFKPETLMLKDSLITFDDAEIAKQGLSKRELFTESAKSLGITLKERVQDESFKVFSEYDVTKPPLENSRAARNNMLLHLIQQRLMDPETLKSRTTPGGFANHSHAAKVLRVLQFGDMEKYRSEDGIDFDKLDTLVESSEFQDPEPNYDPTDPWTIVTYNQQNQVAGKLIGVMANQNSNHAFASLMQEFKLKLPIELCGHSFDDLLHSENSWMTKLFVSELLSSSVDAVKDPVLNYLYLNSITGDTGAVLERLGFSPLEVGLFLNQPVIKKLCAYSFNNNVPVESAIRQITMELDDTLNKYSKSSAKVKRGLSKQQLAECLLKGVNKNDIDFLNTQSEVLEMFSYLTQVSSDISNFITATKFTASNAVGSTFGDLYSQQMKINSYLQKFDSEKGLTIQMKVHEFLDRPVNNANELLNLEDEAYMEILYNNPFAYEQAMYDSNKKALNLLMKYYPYNTSTYQVARNRAASLTKSGTLDGITINKIHNELLVYSLSQQEGSMFNGEELHRRNDGTYTKETNREYYHNSFAKDLYYWLDKHPEIKSKYAIFANIKYDESILSEEDATEDSNNETGFNLGLRIGYDSNSQSGNKDAIKDSWAQLYKDYPLIARDLFLYNFYQLGFGFSFTSFMHLAPVELKTQLQVTSDLSYTDWLRKIQKGDIYIDTEDFLRQFMLNHTDNNKLVYNVLQNSKVGECLNQLIYANNGIAENSITIDLDKIGGNHNSTIKNAFILRTSGTKENPQVHFKPLIKIGDLFYMACATNNLFNVSNNSTMAYVKVNKQGINNICMAYTSMSTKQIPLFEQQDSQDSSIFADNNDEMMRGPETNLGYDVHYDRTSLINKLANDLYTAYQAINANVTYDEVKNMLEGHDNQQLDSLTEAIRSACRKEGILLMDDKGNLLTGC